MDPAGLALGAVSLFGLFSTCLDMLDKVDAYKDFGLESEVFSSILKAQKLGLERWGKAVGLQAENLAPDHHQALDDPQMFSVVQSLLSSIQTILDRSYTDGELALTLPQTATLKNGRIMKTQLQAPGIGSQSRLAKMNWALRKKKNRIEKVDQLIRLLQELYQLIPVSSTKRDNSSSTDHENIVDDLNDTFDTDVRDVLMRMQQIFEVDLRKHLKEWLLGNYSLNDFYEDALQKKLEGTCGWILERPAFKAWSSINPPVDEPKTLWIHGHAGFGKTILCANIAKHMEKLRPQLTTHFFFSAAYESHREPFIAIRSWLWLLMTTNADIRVIVEQHWIDSDGHEATKEVVRQVFREIVQKVPNCSFILDGLDECNCGEDSLASFWRDINTAIVNTATRILIVSRDEPEIRRTIFRYTSERPIVYKILPGDVRSDTALFSKAIVDRRLPKKEFSIRQSLSERMTDRCNGVFLWLYLQERSLRGGRSKKQLEHAIDESPVGLEKLYERSWLKLRQLPEPDHYRALSILQWATFSWQPLTVGELTEALIVDEDSEDFPTDGMPDDIDEDYIDTEIIDLCGSLIEIRHNSNFPEHSNKTLHLAHSSVREYLVRNLPQPSGLNANARLGISLEADQLRKLGKTCLIYINYQSVWAGENRAGASQKIGAFRDYAAEFWHQYLFNSDADDAESLGLVHNFFVASNTSWLAWRAWYENKLPGPNKDNITPRSDSPLFYAVELGLEATVRHLLFEQSLNVNETACGQRTILGAHSSTGDIKRPHSVAANVNTLTSMDISLLCLASRRGFVEISALLLERGADISLTDNAGWTPVSLAANEGHVEVIKLLLEKGADISLADNFGWTPLLRSAFRGHAKVVKLLLEKGANMNMADIDGWTPLNAASYRGHGEVVKLLLKKGANVNVPDRSSKTPLHYATYQGYVKRLKLPSRQSFEEVIKLLLEHGADPNMTDCWGWVPLHLAVYHFNVEIVKLLLENGANVMITDLKGRLPLHAAARRGTVETVKLLLGNISNNCGATKSDSSTGSLATINLGINEPAKASHSIDNFNSKNAPKYAVAMRALHSSRSILEISNYQIFSKDQYHSTPFSLAVRHGQQSLLELLLDEDGNLLKSADIFGRSPIWWAKWMRNVSMEQLLFKLAASKKVELGDPQIPCDVMEFNPSSEAFQPCDICTLTIPLDSINYRCQSGCRRGNFAICDLCYTYGGHCNRRSHILVSYKNEEPEIYEPSEESVGEDEMDCEP